jgi:hypothetical protein
LHERGNASSRINGSDDSIKFTFEDVYKIATGFLTNDQKEEIAYFISVRSFIMSSKSGTPDLKDINERISRLLEDATHRAHDWDKKEQAPARMWLYIKKVLRKHGYPPNKEPKAVEDVLEHAKLQASNM